MGYAFKLVAMIKPAICFAETIFFYCNFLLPKVIYKVLVIQLTWQVLHSRYVSSSLVFHACVMKYFFFLPQVVNLLSFRDIDIQIIPCGYLLTLVNVASFDATHLLKDIENHKTIPINLGESGSWGVAACLHYAE